MTKLITVGIIVVVLYLAYHLFLYWEKVKNEEETQQKQTAAAMAAGDSLPGLPYQLENSLQAARKRGAGHGERSAGVGGAGDCGAGRARHHPGQPGLPH